MLFVEQIVGPFPPAHHIDILVELIALKPGLHRLNLCSILSGGPTPTALGDGVVRFTDTTVTVK